jgi:HSP20 family protein
MTRVPGSGVILSPMADGSHRSSKGSGAFPVHLADELEVYFNEVAHGRPVGFVGSPKWKPPTDVYETAEDIVVHMDVAGVQPEDFTVEYAEGVLTIAGERPPRHEGKPHYHAMEVQVGPFERRLRLPVSVDPTSLRATYDNGFLEVRLTKLPQRLSGPHTVKVT